MVTYTYKCTNCNHIFEVKQRMSDAALTDCPNCHKAMVRRIINQVRVVFKGTGFYSTEKQ